MRRHLCAVLAADVVGYSGLMAEDEAATLTALKALFADIIEPSVTEHGGRIVKLLGDGVLATLPSATDAVTAALGIQQELAKKPGRPKLRIGVNIGDVIEDDADVFGDGVNIAARLETMAPPGGICLSALVHACLPADLGSTFTDAGSHRFKNIPRPIGVFSWPSGAALAPGEEIETFGRTATVALLPFEDLTGAAEHRHLSTGLNDDLTAMLSNVDELRLAGGLPSSGDRSAARIGRELGVDWIIRGSVRAAGTRIRVSVQLIESATERTVWARRFDGGGKDADVFDFQDAIVEEVAATLQVTVADGEQAMVWRAEAGDARAYQYFLEARASYKEYRRAGIARARTLYEQALDITPQFPAALVGLARTHIEDANWGWSPDRVESLAEARKLLDQALEIAPDHALACSEMAHLLMVSKEFDNGLEWAMRAIRLAPALGDAYHVGATLLNCADRPEDALHYIRQAIERAPSAPDFYLATMSDAYAGLGRWRETLALTRSILARRPNWLMVRAMLVISLWALDQKAEARREAETIRARSPRFTAAVWRRSMYNPDRKDIARLEAMLVAAGLPA
jgi:class 3 adenylate cyclase/TolB-like protein/Tfp pilus assembly protein PilF